MAKKIKRCGNKECSLKNYCKRFKEIDYDMMQHPFMSNDKYYCENLLS